MALIDGNIITTFVNKFVDDLTSVIVKNSVQYNEQLLRATSAFIAAAFLVYLVWRCIEYITEDNPPPITIVFKEIMVLTLLGAFTFGGSLYTGTVTTFIMDSGDDLARAITGQSAITSIVSMVGGFLTKFFALTDKVEGLSLWEIGIVFILGFLTFLISLYILIKFFIECLATLVLIKFMSGILVSIGGLFICAAYFKPTRRMFFSWWGVAANYILTNVVLCIAISLIVDVITSKITDVDFSSLLILICCLIAGEKIIGHIPGLISQLTSSGGGGISMKNEFGAKDLKDGMTSGASSIKNGYNMARSLFKGGIGKA